MSYINHDYIRGKAVKDKRKNPGAASSSDHISTKRSHQKVSGGNSTVLWTNPGGGGGEFVVRRPASARSISSTKSGIKKSTNSASPNGRHSSRSVKTVKKSSKTKQNHFEETHKDVSTLNDLTSSIESFIVDDNDNHNFSVNRESMQNSSISEDEFELSKYEIKNDYLQNHCCSGCRELMIQNHIPLIVYPCGHTFCSVCLEKAKSCPACKITITSVQQNTTLESVIMNYIEEKKQKEEEEKRIKIEKYLTDMEDVDTRCELLQSEASSVIDTMETITENIVNEENNMEALKKRAIVIREDVERLQTKLKNCEKEHSLASSKHRKHEENYEKHKKQLMMIEKTMKSLQKNKQSIRKMIENIQPDYFSESDDD